MQSCACDTLKIQGLLRDRGVCLKVKGYWRNMSHFAAERWKEDTEGLVHWGKVKGQESAASSQTAQQPTAERPESS